MILVPFLYFTALTFFWWKRHGGLDVCVYMSALYALTALCSVGVVAFGLLGSGSGIHFDDYDIELGIVPTFLYCGLLTLGMFPFSLIYRKEVKLFKSPSSMFLECFCWLLFAVALINLYLIADSTAEILSGDLSTVRSDHYAGIESPAEVKAQSLPRIFGYIIYFRSATILGLPLFFFFCSCEKKRPWWFLAMLLLTSITMPLFGLQMADRTEFTFYGMMFIFCLIFFWKFLSRGFKRSLVLIGTPLVGVVLLYMVAVSQARFSEGDDDTKAYESALAYAGQNYLNFCFFWENAKFEYIAPEREFPFTCHYLQGIDSTPDRRDERSGKQGFFISVFPTYIGDVMLDLSPIGLILWCTVLFLLTTSVIHYSHREEFDVGDVLAIFTLAVIPIFGIFYYRYYSQMFMYLFLSVAAVYFFSKHNIIFSNEEPTADTE